MHQSPIKCEQEFAGKKVKVYFQGNDAKPGDTGEFVFKDMAPQWLPEDGLHGRGAGRNH